MERAGTNTLTDIRHRAKTLSQKKVKVMESRNRTDVAQRVPRGLGFQIS